MIWLVMLAWGAVAEDCPAEPIEQLHDAVARAEQAWQQLDGPALDGAIADLQGVLPCVGQELTLEDAVSVHRTLARHASSVFDPTRSTAGWLAVRDLAPDQIAALELEVGPDEPVRLVWESRRPVRQRLSERPPRGWVVDGTDAEDVPSDRAFILQARGRRGGVTYTGWHLSPTTVPLEDWRAQRVRRLRGRGSVVAGLLMAGGVGALAQGMALRDYIKRPNTPEENLVPAKRQSDAMLVGGAGGVGTGLVTLGVLWGVRW